MHVCKIDEEVAANCGRPRVLKFYIIVEAKEVTADIKAIRTSQRVTYIRSIDRVNATVKQYMILSGKFAKLVSRFSIFPPLRLRRGWGRPPF
jgi:hypothetical protein